MPLELVARELLEAGNLREFEEFLVTNAENIEPNYSFEEQISFLILVVQTFRKFESLVVDRNEKVPLEDYKNTMTFLVEIGCDLNKGDVLGRTVAHWTILLKSLELLSVCLRLGFNTLLQDNEGQTIAHLAIRQMDTMVLETIKLYARDANVLEATSNSSGATPLIYAVQIGARDIVEKLLQLSVMVDTQENNKYKRTALHYALFTDHEEIFELLLKHKAKTNIKDYKNKSVIDRVAEHPKDNFLRTITHYSSADIFSSGNTDTLGYSPIMTACKNNDFDMVCELLNNTEETEKSSQILKLDSDLRCALHYCADNTDEKCAEKLIQLAPELILKRDKNGFSPLHLATISNNVKLVELLLRNGCQIKEQDNEGHTSLHWAVVCCCVEIVSILLSKEPQIIHIGDAFGASPLHYSTQSFLNPDGSIHGATVIEKLLKHQECNIDCIDDENRTPLLWAACLGITDCCQILLENGANINHRDNKGLTVLHCAASRGHYDIVDLLVTTWSMTVDCEDNNLCTPLFYAVTLKHLKIIDFLFDHRCYPNHQDIKGRSVAHCAALKGYCDVLNIILNYGGSICLPNKDGDLPLHEAAETGKLEVCQFLVNKMEECNETALINSINKIGYTALHKAAQHNFSEICQLLLEYSANSNIEAILGGDENHKVTPLDLASDATTINVLKNADENHKVTSLDLASDATTINVFKNADGDRKVCESTLISSANERVIGPRGSSPFKEDFNKDYTELTFSKNNSKSTEDSEDLRSLMSKKGAVSIKMSTLALVPSDTEAKNDSDNNIRDSKNKNIYINGLSKRRIRDNRPPFKPIMIRSPTRSSNNLNTNPISAKSTRNIKSEPTSNDSVTTSSASLNATPGSSSTSLRNDHKTPDLYKRIIKSVKEYASVRDRMRTISDQRRMEMFEGFSKTAKLNKYSTKPRVSRSSKYKKYSDAKESGTELPPIVITDCKEVRKLRTVTMSADEQIKSAYHCDSTLSTLILY